MNQAIGRGVEFARRHGWGELAREIPSYLYRQLRPYVPTADRLVYNGITVSRRQAVTDPYLPTWLCKHVPTDRPAYEQQYVSALRSHVQEGERVVLVGGGGGVSTVAAARQVGPEGSVVVYEASAGEVERTRTTARLNGVDDRVTVIHATVAVAGSLRGPSGDAPVVPASELTVCDTLAVDADGAEFAVLDGLCIRPDRLVVEHHLVSELGRVVTPYEPGRLRTLVESRGYEVADERTRRERLPHAVEGRERIEEQVLVAEELA